MELYIHFKALPEALTLQEIEFELADVLEDTGWPVGSGQGSEESWVELDLEDERNNPKYAIMAVKSYCQKRRFQADTTIELAGTRVGIYE